MSTKVRPERLFTVEIIFQDGPEARRHVLRDLKAHDVKRLREEVFFAGLLVAVKDTATEWEIISPFRILKIALFLQEPVPTLEEVKK